MTKFLEESPGNKSASRLLLVVGGFWAMAMVTGFAIFTKATLLELGEFFALVVGVLGGIKVGNKFGEKG